MKGKGFSRGPVGGAGLLANKGLSRSQDSGNHNNGRNNKERKPIFGVSAYVNAVLNKLRVNGKPLPGVYFSKDGKTVLATELRTDGNKILASILRTEVRAVNFFRFTAEERYARDYGRVNCTEKGNALPKRFMRNGNWVGQQARYYDGLVQPAYVFLTRLTIVEAIGRAGIFKVTCLHFKENSKDDISIVVESEEFVLEMPEDLKERFMYQDADEVSDPVAIEASLMKYLKANADNQEELASWEPFVRPMTVAYAKACGQQNAFYLEQETEDLSPEATVASEAVEALFQATGTDNGAPVIEIDVDDAIAEQQANAISAEKIMRRGKNR